MKRFGLSLILLSGLLLPVSAQTTSSVADSTDAVPTLQSGVTWTVEEARREALRNLDNPLRISDFPPVDPLLVKHLQETTGNEVKVGNRKITHFGSGMYSVAYDGENEVYYYHQNGTLFKVSVCSEAFGTAAKYPRQCVDYAYPSGNILAVSLDVASEETFVFQPNGTFLNHWVGTSAYDEAGNLRGERW